MRGSMREEGGLVEDSDEDRVEEGVPPNDSDQYTLVQPSESPLLTLYELRDKKLIPKLWSS